MSERACWCLDREPDFVEEIWWKLPEGQRLLPTACFVLPEKTRQHMRVEIDPGLFVHEDANVFTFSAGA
jgi:hypothetical protein